MKAILQPVADIWALVEPFLAYAGNRDIHTSIHEAFGLQAGVVTLRACTCYRGREREVFVRRINREDWEHVEARFREEWKRRRG